MYHCLSAPWETRVRARGCVRFPLRQKAMMAAAIIGLIASLTPDAGRRLVDLAGTHLRVLTRAHCLHPVIAAHECSSFNHNWNCAAATQSGTIVQPVLYAPPSHLATQLFLACGGRDFCQQVRSGFHYFVCDYNCGCISLCADSAADDASGDNSNTTTSIRRSWPARCPRTALDSEVALQRRRAADGPRRALFHAQSVHPQVAGAHSMSGSGEAPLCLYESSDAARTLRGRAHYRPHGGRVTRVTACAPRAGARRLRRFCCCPPARQRRQRS